MKFNLSFEIESSKAKINLSSKVLTIGSCFSDVVGNQLINYKIKADSNPFGTVFNPASIFKLLNQSIENKPVESRHFMENNETWLHYDFHSRNNDDNELALKKQLENLQSEVGEKLQSADFLILTFGTAYAYQLLETNGYVSNCHKMPAHLFRKDLLHVKHICQEFEYFYKKIKVKNPKIKIILTVSPVRHTKDGIPENSLSKSILRAACHYLCLDFADVQYFPAYEIMMDELRDYRFYGEDMIHPNKIAEEYIFERFSKAYFDDKLLEFTSTWTKIKQDLTHRPFKEKSEQHQKFLNKLLQKLDEISKIVDVQKEKEEVLSRIFVENSDI